MKFADLDLNQVYTYADYLKWNFEERVELLRGKIFKMSPAPNRMHQKLSWLINKKLSDVLSGKSCEVYYAPFDVRIPRKTKDDKDIVTVFQPDICVVCDPSKLDDKGCLGAPDIVVEILSPGNNSKEMRNKFDIYEEAGVKEYWIVSPQDQTFLVYTLNEYWKFDAHRAMAPGDVVTSSVLPGFTMDLEELFGGV